MNILITGARSNLGYNYAKELAKRGHIVYVGVKTLNQKSTLEKRLDEEKIIMFPIVLDLDENDFSIIDTLNLDAIILQASKGEGGSILEINYKRVEANINTNILGNFKIIQRYLRYCYYNNKKGKIFLTSSLASLIPLPYLFSYTSSKLYLLQLAKTLKIELFYQNIDVKISLIMPGAYYTGFNDLMIDNKEKDSYILRNKAIKMTKYQKILFALFESYDYKDITIKVVKEIEKTNPKFIISRPYYQKLFVKIYMIISSFIV
mgnify:CR=1 FL=1